MRFPSSLLVGPHLEMSCATVSLSASDGNFQKSFINWTLSFKVNRELASARMMNEYLQQQFSDVNDHQLAFNCPSRDHLLLVLTAENKTKLCVHILRQRRRKPN